MFLDKVSGTSPHLPHATPQRRAPARIATICTCAAALVLVATASAAESGKSSSAIGSWGIAKWAGGVLWSAVVWFVGRWFFKRSTGPKTPSSPAVNFASFSVNGSTSSAKPLRRRPHELPR